MPCYVFYEDGTHTVHDKWPSTRYLPRNCYANLAGEHAYPWGIPSGESGWDDIDEHDVPPEIRMRLLLIS